MEYVHWYIPPRYGMELIQFIVIRIDENVLVAYP